MEKLPYTKQQIIEAHEIMARIQAIRLLGEIPEECFRKTPLKADAMDKYHSPRETADILGMGLSTLREKTRLGHIKPVDPTAKRRRYSTSEIKRYQRENQKE